MNTLVFQDFVADWSPEESSRRLQQGKVTDRQQPATSISADLLTSSQVVPLEKFRSLRDKLSLLDSAISTHDGNVITAVKSSKI